MPYGPAPSGNISSATSVGFIFSPNQRSFSAQYVRNSKSPPPQVNRLTQLNYFRRQTKSRRKHSWTNDKLLLAIWCTFTTIVCIWMIRLGLSKKLSLFDSCCQQWATEQQANTVHTILFAFIYEVRTLNARTVNAEAPLVLFIPYIWRKKNMLLYVVKLEFDKRQRRHTKKWRQW